MPPGVSYMPRLFMPTKRFSTRSSRPMPLSRPSSLSLASSVAGDSFLPSIATASPFSKSMVMTVGLSGASSGSIGARIDVVRHFLRRVLQHLALGRGVQEVGVDRERRLAALVLGDRDLVLLGEGDQLLARAQVPFAPGRDHGDVGLQRVIGELEADLIVALAGRAMGRPRRRRPSRRSRSASWRSAAARSRCRADTAPS